MLKEFVKRFLPLPMRWATLHKPLSFQNYKEYESIRMYEGFEEAMSNGKYDLICVDGPIGGDLIGCARIDILPLLRNNLADSFSILVDDYNRIQEQNMVKDLLSTLDDLGIAYAKSIYKGTKQTIIICSENQKFLTSL